MHCAPDFGLSIVNKEPKFAETFPARKFLRYHFPCPRISPHPCRQLATVGKGEPPFKCIPGGEWGFLFWWLQAWWLFGGCYSCTQNGAPYCRFVVPTKRNPHLQQSEQGRFHTCRVSPLGAVFLVFSDQAHSRSLIVFCQGTDKSAHCALCLVPLSSAKQPSLCAKRGVT